MDVKGILQQVAHIGSGLDNPALDDQEIHLQYLNLVHLELYRLTAMHNPRALMEQLHGEVENGFFNQPIECYTISCVYDKINRQKLKQVSFQAIVDEDPMFEKIGKPTAWCNYNNQIMVYPKLAQPMPLMVWCKAPPRKLELETKESEIPYPAFYHQVLVDGTAYYVFQSETGLKNSAEFNAAMARWELGKRELLAYFSNTAGLGENYTYTEV